MPQTGIQAFVDLLADFGVRYLFGNPGTTELPLNDLLAVDRRLEYVLGLSEVPTVAMADGYSMATGNLAVVNVHISCGLGNSMGMLYNAYCAGTPLLVTAGQQDRRLDWEEPVLAGDLVSVAAPWTKWAANVNRVRDLPVMLRRAVQTAMTPPTGPVFLSMPMDLQLEQADELDMSSIRLPSYETPPPAEPLAAAAAILRSAKRPAILAGSRVLESGGTAALVRLAEQLGAPVYSEAPTAHGRLPFPSHHPLYGQALPLWSPEVRGQLDEFDVIFAVGLNVLRQYLYQEPARPLPDHARLVQLDHDARQLNKNYAADLALWGNIRLGLEQLSELVAREMDPACERAAAERSEQFKARHTEARQALVHDARREKRLTALSAMHAIARSLPANAAVVEEAVTTTQGLLERFGAIQNPAAYFGHRGWALGWGLGCAMGVQLAWPDARVVAIIGEGSATYGIQGLWTAAHRQLPVTFVVSNNREYRILKVCARELGLPAAAESRFEAMDLIEPEIDFCQLAQSMGVPSIRVSNSSELADVIRDMPTRTSPLLVDVPVQD